MGARRCFRSNTMLSAFLCARVTIRNEKESRRDRLRLDWICKPSFPPYPLPPSLFSFLIEFYRYHVTYRKGGGYSIPPEEEHSTRMDRKKLDRKEYAISRIRLRRRCVPRRVEVVASGFRAANNRFACSRLTSFYLHAILRLAKDERGRWKRIVSPKNVNTRGASWHSFNIDYASLAREIHLFLSRGRISLVIEENGRNSEVVNVYHLPCLKDFKSVNVKMFINLNKYMIKRKTCNDRDTWSGGTKDLINICPESNPCLVLFITFHIVIGFLPDTLNLYRYLYVNSTKIIISNSRMNILFAIFIDISA